MYNPSGGAILPATGAAFFLWGPLAAIAIVMLGVALVRAAGTFRREGP